MRICTSRQMAAIDAATIQGGTPGLELMERAGVALTAELKTFAADRLGLPDPRVAVVCGKGNNGGDGLVMARRLAEQGCTVSVMLMAPAAGLSDEARANHERLPTSVAVRVAVPEEWVATLGHLAESADLLVDAVFGTGIRPPVRPDHAALFTAMNAAGLPVVSVDIPSGVDGDDGAVDPVAVKADLTLTVGLPKRGCCVAPGRDHVGELRVVDIGFDPDLCRRSTDDLNRLDTAAYRDLLPSRRSDGHKYQCGRLLIVAGSRAFAGAAHLTAQGGLRSGAGLVTLGAPESAETALRAGLPEVVVRALAPTATGTIAPLEPSATKALLARQDALALGPGLDAHPETDRWVLDLVEGLPEDLPLVLDADGLGALARLEAAPDAAGRPWVLTPHAGEFARLGGGDPGRIAAEPWAVAREAAQRWGCVLVLKGSPSWIATPDGAVHVNPTGDDALARGGSGDLLTGLVGGLLAQGCSPRDAALLGCYIHGRAGTAAAHGQSTRTVTVSEIAGAVGPVVAELETFGRAPRRGVSP